MFSYHLQARCVHARTFFTPSASSARTTPAAASSAVGTPPSPCARRREEITTETTKFQPHSPRHIHNHHLLCLQDGVLRRPSHSQQSRNTLGTACAAFAQANQVLRWSGPDELSLKGEKNNENENGVRMRNVPHLAFALLAQAHGDMGELWHDHRLAHSTRCGQQCLVQNMPASVSMPTTMSKSCARTYAASKG